MRLYLRDDVVSEMANAFESQDTWYATLTESPSGEAAEFACFCLQWHERLAADESPEADEFDVFAAHRHRWSVRDEGGNVLQVIDDWPVFLQPREVSWRVRT